MLNMVQVAALLRKHIKVAYPDSPGLAIESARRSGRSFCSAYLPGTNARGLSAATSPTKCLRDAGACRRLRATSGQGSTVSQMGHIERDSAVPRLLKGSSRLPEAVDRAPSGRVALRRQAPREARSPSRRRSRRARTRTRVKGRFRPSDR